MKCGKPSQNGVCRLKLNWTKRALRQLIQAQDYIARDNPSAAKIIAERIIDAAKLFVEQPKIGRPGRIAGTREWVVGRTPYLLVYTVQNGEIWIISVIHSKQDWPGA